MSAAPDRGDLAWMDPGKTAGHEQAGRRPVLVLTPRAYNAKVGLALCCPITSRAKGYPFEVPLPDGLPLQGVVLSDHVTSLDWRARRAKVVAKATPPVLDEVLAKLDALLGAH